MKQIHYRENTDLHRFYFDEIKNRFNPRLYEVNPSHPRTNLNNKKIKISVFEIKTKLSDLAPSWQIQKK